MYLNPCKATAHKLKLPLPLLFFSNSLLLFASQNAIMVFALLFFFLPSCFPYETTPSDRIALSAPNSELLVTTVYLVDTENWSLFHDDYF